MAAGNWAVLIVAGLVASACTADRGQLPLVGTPALNSVAPFSLHGVVTDGVHAIPGVLVKTVPPSLPGSIARSMLTDAGGAFSFFGLTEPTALTFEKVGYHPTGFSAASTDHVVNVALVGHSQILAGESIAGTVWGDSLIVFDFDGNPSTDCGTKPCTVIYVTSGAPGVLTARLQWNGPENELRLSFYGEDGAVGQSPLEISGKIFKGESSVLVTFEKSGGAAPPPGAHQDFELTTAFAPLAP